MHPRLHGGTLRRLGLLRGSFLDRAIDRRVRRHGLPHEAEQAIVQEVERCWDGVPLPRPLAPGGIRRYSPRPTLR